MERIEYKWTDGKNEDFQKFYLTTDAYYSEIVGGIKNRHSFVPYNISEAITDVLIAYYGTLAIGCAGLKRYSDNDVEVKRVWVEPGYRGKHIATELMGIIENKAKQQDFRRTILQTRKIMVDAVGLYSKLGYYQIENYSPYDKLEGAICFAKDL